MIAELVAEGVEGGSWRAVAHSWNYKRLKLLRDEWKRRPSLREWAAAYFDHKPEKQTDVPAMFRDAMARSHQLNQQQSQSQSQQPGLGTPMANVLSIAEFVQKQGGVYRG